MRNLLLPHSFRRIGWVLLAITVPLALFYFVSDPLNNSILSRACINPAAFNIIEKVIINFLIIGSSLGSLFVGCARVREEDEMTRTIRLNALLTALYIYVGIIAVTALFIYGLLYIYVMYVNLCLFPLVFMIVFELRMRAYRKLSDEENGADDED